MTMAPGETVTVNLLLLALGGFGAGAAGALLAAREPAISRWVGHAGALIGAMAACALGVAGLAGGTLNVVIPALLPIGGFSLGMDRLSAFFVLGIATAAIPSAVYAVAYTHSYEGRSSLAGMGLGLNTFLAAMVLVVLARNALTFLVMWEAMSLASYFLVMTEAENRETEQAGWLYLVTTHAGFACLLIGFLLMAHGTGTMVLGEWRAASTAVDGPTRDAIFILLALGFGTKAGVVPLHIWLPKAHPAAPSHVSA
ncbi:MAG: hydrogenase 4 subunit B, partial [candidate division NC10 bacterium]|nr:hydrogenase 4 subunit B [candidate division NC10 bacterium]